MCQPPSHTTVFNNTNASYQEGFIRLSKDDMRRRVQAIFAKQREASSQIDAKSLVERASLGSEDLFSKAEETSSLKKSK